VLVDSAGLPKLADFGVAKLRTLIQPGLTLNQFVSRPFAPPEDDDLNFTYTRDVFAFAALVANCLAQIRLTSYVDLDNAVADLDVPPDVFSILTSCLSRDPATRLANASVLLAQLDAIQEKRREAWAPKETLYLQLTQTAVINLRKAFTSESKEQIEERLTQDLSVFAIDRYVAPDNSSPKGQYSVYGSEFHYQVVVDNLKGAHLVVLNAWRLSPTLVERRRENAYVPNAEFKFGIPTDIFKGELL
jgi:serine/threonine protein kinase